MVASMVVSGVLLLAMIAASVWAAVALPASARLALHFGSVEHCYLVPKRAGLVLARRGFTGNDVTPPPLEEERERETPVRSD